MSKDSNLAPDIILNGTGYWNTDAGWIDGEAVDGGTDWWVGPLLDDPQLTAALDRILELENEEMQHLYHFINPPEIINYNFLGLVDLSSPNTVLAVLAAGGQYLQMKMMVSKKQDDKKQDTAKAIQAQMIYFLPGFTFIILLSLPSVVGLYWIITVAFSVFQQYIVKKEDDGKENNGRDKKNS